MKKLTETDIDNTLLNSNLKRVGEYTTSIQCIIVTCNICNYTRPTNVGRLLYSVRRGHSPCPQCSNRIHYTNNIIDEKIKHRNLARLSDWSGDLIRMTWKCLDCDHVWKTRISKIINENTNCPKCSYANRYAHLRLTNQQIDARLKHRNIKRIGDYPGSMTTKTEWACLDCDYHWTATSDKVVGNYTGCPSCANTGGGKFGKKKLCNGELFGSQLEYNCYCILRDAIADVIIRQHKYLHNSRMTCDFVVPDRKLWIEVSNLKTPEYLNRIERKRKAIEELGETFVFIHSPTEMKNLCTSIIPTCS